MMPALFIVSFFCSAVTAGLLWGIGLPLALCVAAFFVSIPCYWIYFAKRLHDREVQ